jgi:hypothetical protein
VDTSEPPYTPFNFKADVTSPSAIKLTWIDTSLNEEGFTIYRNGINIAMLDSDSTHYDDTDLVGGETYRYTVSAYNKAGKSGALSCTVKMASPSLNVTVHQIGIKAAINRDQDLLKPDNIGLIFLASDGKKIKQGIIPPAEAIYFANDYALMELNEHILQITPKGDYLNIGIIGYDAAEPSLSDSLQKALPYLSSIFMRQKDGDMSKVIADYKMITGKPLFENENNFAGYFQGSWSMDEAWGIRQYNSVGTDELKVWLSIWLNGEPSSEPEIELSPEVIVKSVDIASELKTNISYAYPITLNNKESNATSVTLNVYSSIDGDVSDKSVVVPANSNSEVRQQHVFQTAGVHKVTYTILSEGKRLCSLSKIVNIMAPDITVDSIDMPEDIRIGKDYTIRISLKNNESYSVTIDLNENSSVTGDMGNESVSIPAGGIKVVERRIRFQSPGISTITHTVLHNSMKLHSLSTTVNAKAPDVRILEIEDIPVSEIDDTPELVVVDRIYHYSIVLRNDESDPVTVELRTASDIHIDSYEETKSVTVPANGTKSIGQTIRFRAADRGVITFSTFYKGAELDSVSIPVDVS